MREKFYRRLRCMRARALSLAFCTLLVHQNLYAQTQYERYDVNGGLGFGFGANIPGWGNYQRNWGYSPKSGAQEVIEFQPDTPLFQTSNDRLFYRIGGGALIQRPPSFIKPKQTLFNFNGSINLGLDCGGFNFDNMLQGDFDWVNLSNKLSKLPQELRQTLTKTYKKFLGALTGSATAIPGLVLKRVNPTLYEIISGRIFELKMEYDDSLLSCENMSKMGANFALDLWEGAANRQSYKKIVKETHGDPREIRALDNEKQKKQENEGVYSFGGNPRGGKNQEPIYFTYDIARAGLNAQLGKSFNEDKVKEDECQKAEICRTFGSDEKMLEWITDVLGDRPTITCRAKDCGIKQRKDKARLKTPKGLAAMFEQEAQILAKDFDEVLGKSALSKEDLRKISADDLQITRGLIEKLRGSENISILASRLVQEVAMMKTLKKARLARRAIVAGMNDPHTKHEESHNILGKETLAALDAEIMQVKMELELSKLMVGNTQQAIIDDYNRRATEYSGFKGKEVNPVDTFININKPSP